MKGCALFVLLLLTPFLFLAGPIGWILALIALLLILK